MKALRGMLGLRSLLALVGVGFGLWGLWLMRDFDVSQLTSMFKFLVAGVLVHDAILAPVVVVVGFAAAGLLPGHARSIAAVAFLIWGTVTIAVTNVLTGQGGSSGNSTIIGRPYVLSWLIMTAVLVVAAAIAAWSRRSRHAMG